MAITETAKNDSRGSESKFPIVRGAALTFEITATTITVKTSLNGELLGFIYTCPDLTTDTTFQIDILDSDNAILYTKNDFPDNKTTSFAVHLAAADRRFLFGNELRFVATIVTSQAATIVLNPIYR